MPRHIKQLTFLAILLLCAGPLMAEKDTRVVYPDWFKDSLFDLPGDLQEAKEAGKDGILLFFSMKTCSYCKAIIDTSLQQADIVKRLRAKYDVIGIEVFSDTEVVDLNGKSHWSKDFAVTQKAQFTPTMIFYGTDGKLQLRLVGYQSPAKFRAALDYLQQKKYTSLRFRDFLHQRKAAAASSSEQAAALELKRSKGSKPLLVVFETADCQKCNLMRAMLNAPVQHAYTTRLDIAYLTPAHMNTTITTPEGKQLTGQAWLAQLGLIHSPALVFFTAQGKEGVRVDTDILIDANGRDVPADHPYVLSNIRARLQYFLDGGYISMPQFQRWRAQTARNQRQQVK